MSRGAIAQPQVNGRAPAGRSGPGAGGARHVVSVKAREAFPAGGGRPPARDTTLPPPTQNGGPAPARRISSARGTPASKMGAGGDGSRGLKRAKNQGSWTELASKVGRPGPTPGLMHAPPPSSSPPCAPPRVFFGPAPRVPASGGPGGPPGQRKKILHASFKERLLDGTGRPPHRAHPAPPRPACR